MVKDHSDSERGIQLPPYELLFPICSDIYPTYRITHTTDFVTPIVEHWLEREVAQWVHHAGSIQRLIAPWATRMTDDNDTHYEALS